MPKTNMFDPSTFKEGGASLNGIVGVVISSTFKWTNWAKEDGSIPVYKTGPNAGQEVKPSTVWEIKVKPEDRDDPITALISVSGVLKPSKDGVMPAKDDEGSFLCHPEGKDVALNKTSAAAAFVESLVNASFDFELFNENGAVALEGYGLAFEEKEARKGSDGKPMGRGQTIVTKVVHGPGAKKGAKAAAKPAAKPAGKPKPKEEEAEEEVDIEATVTDAIQLILAEESPLPKAKVSMKLNKALSELGLENADRMKALKLATSDEFLSNGPWVYDKKSLAAAEE